VDLETPVAAVMTRDPLTVDAAHSLDDARRAMTERGFHHVPVVAGGRLVGMLSGTDLLRVSPGVAAVPLQASAAPPGTVRSLMVRDVVTIAGTATIGQALAVFSTGRFHALPVVDDSGALVGLLTTTDLVCHLGRRAP
jgi:CBS domain-containing protein